MADTAAVLLMSAAGLTLRERQVLAALAEGLTVKEAAARMGVSRWTVRHHVREASRRLGAQTYTQAVAIAIREHLIAA